MVTWVRIIGLFAVATEYAWEILETAQRIGLEPVCLDNLGSADPDLPGLVEPSRLHEVSRTVRVIVAPARPDQRQLAVTEAERLGFEFADSLADPRACVAATSELGVGTIVNAGAVVGARTAIGHHVNINRSASIGHHNTLGEFVSTGPGAITAGCVRVGAGAFLGAGCVVLPGITIGAGALIGAGAIVTTDVPPFETVVGNPARPVR